MNYLLAYKDRYGNDFHGTPWLHEIARNTLKSGKIMAKEFAKMYSNVILFACTDEELQNEEIITWDFVNKHKIDY